MQKSKHQGSQKMSYSSQRDCQEEGKCLISRGVCFDPSWYFLAVVIFNHDEFDNVIKFSKFHY